MIEITDKSKILILILLVGLVIYLLSGSSKQQSEPIHNQGSLQQTATNRTNNTDTDSLPNNSDNVSTESSNSSSQSSLANNLLMENTNTYKSSSYAEGNRNQASNLDKFFSNENPLDQPSNGFSLSNDGKNYAVYTPGSGEKQQDDDKFDAAALMPQEQNDWFDDPQAKKNINSPHLINTFRPLGVNTIQSTLKNASWDIRGAPANPKYVVSPWGNSSYEPDTNLKNGALCV